MVSGGAAWGGRACGVAGVLYALPLAFLLRERMALAVGTAGAGDAIADTESAGRPASDGARPTVASA